MDGGGPLQKWEELERTALKCADDAAEWVTHLFDDRTGFFHVAVERDAVQNVRPRRAEDEALTPNAATSIIQLATARVGGLHWGFSDRKAWHALETAVEKSRTAVADANASVTLPLKSFGLLPLFSTTYLAQVLGQLAKTATPDTVNPAYAIAIRRLLCAARTDFTATYSSQRDGLHPFVTCHLARALQILSDIKQPAFDAVIAKANDQVFIGANLPSKKLLKAPELSAENLDISAPADIKPLLTAIEEATVRELIFATTQDGSMRSGVADVSAIAFAMLTLAERDLPRHTPLLIQTLRNLVATDFRWPMPVGRPFYSDAKGRALYVPSVEIANALLIVTLQLVDKLSDELFDTILDRSSDFHVALVERYITFQAKAEEEPKFKGWSTDRAPSSSRIDSWTTAQAAEFFANRVNLLRWRKRRHVLNNYNWKPWRRCDPSWEQMVNPDEGDASRNLKGDIEAALRKDSDGGAPVFLLYGPPGTSKTTLAEAIARSRRWDLISLSPSDFVTDSLDRIEQRSRQIFRDLTAVDKCVIVFDEIDSLLRDRAAVRKSNPGTMIEFVIPSLLPKLQALRDYTRDREMAVFFISNYRETIDSAILRGGRIDHHFCVLPYTIAARKSVAAIMLGKLKLDETTPAHRVVMETLEKAPRNLVYRDIDRVIKLATASATPNTEEILQSLQRLKIGVQPGIYEWKLRADAYAEVLAFLSRVTGQELPEDVGEADSTEVRNFFEKLAETRNKPWSTLAEQWLKRDKN